MNDIIKRLAIELILEQDPPRKRLPLGSVSISPGTRGVTTSVVGSPATQSDIAPAKFLKSYGFDNEATRIRMYRTAVSLLYFLGNPEQYKSYEEYAKGFGITPPSEQEIKLKFSSPVFGLQTIPTTPNVKDAWDTLFRIVQGKEDGNPRPLKAILDSAKDELFKYYSAGDQGRYFLDFLEIIGNDINNAYKPSAIKDVITQLVGGSPSTGAVGQAINTETGGTATSQNGRVEISNELAKTIGLMEFMEERYKYVGSLEGSEESTKGRKQIELQNTNRFIDIFADTFRSLVTLFNGKNTFIDLLQRQLATKTFLEKIKDKIYKIMQEAYNPKRNNQKGNLDILNTKRLESNLATFFGKIKQDNDLKNKSILSIESKIESYVVPLTSKILAFYDNSNDITKLNNLFKFTDFDIPEYAAPVPAEPAPAEPESAPTPAELAEPEPRPAEPAEPAEPTPRQGILRRMYNKVFGRRRGPITENYVRKCIVDTLLERKVDFSLIQEEYELVLFKKLIATEAKIIKNKQTKKELSEHKTNVKKFELLTGFTWPVEDEQ